MGQGMQSLWTSDHLPLHPGTCFKARRAPHNPRPVWVMLRIEDFDPFQGCIGGRTRQSLNPQQFHEDIIGINSSPKEFCDPIVERMERELRSSTNIAEEGGAVLLEAILGHPWLCGGLGVPNRRSNHALTMGWVRPMRTSRT